MSKATAFVILGALLLLQGYSTKPHGATEPKSSESAETDREVNLKATQFAVSLLLEVSTYADAIFEKGEKLTRDVLADAIATGDKSNEEINRRIEILSHTVDKLDKLKERNSDELEKQKWEIGKELLTIMEKIVIKTEKNLTAEDRVFNDYFEKHGIDAYFKDIETKSKEFINRVREHFGYFWNELSINEQEEYKEFNNWYKKFEEESDSVEKIEIIGDLFNLFH